jgi:hypothetical protein
VTNPFHEKAAKARAEYERLASPTAWEKGMAESFPLGAGFGHGSQRSRDRSTDASVNRAVATEEAHKRMITAENQATTHEREKTRPTREVARVIPTTTKEGSKDMGKTKELGYSAPAVHTEAREGGKYEVHEAGAGVHDIHFTPAGARTPKLVARAGSVEGAKARIEDHAGQMAQKKAGIEPPEPKHGEMRTIVGTQPDDKAVHASSASAKASEHDPAKARTPEAASAHLEAAIMHRAAAKEPGADQAHHDAMADQHSAAAKQIKGNMAAEDERRQRISHSMTAVHAERKQGDLKEAHRATGLEAHFEAKAAGGGEAKAPALQAGERGGQCYVGPGGQKVYPGTDARLGAVADKIRGKGK